MAGLFPKTMQVVVSGWFLFLYDFQYRYGVSFFGYFWPVLKPILGIIPLVFIGKALDLHGKSLEMPYELYVISGYLLWLVFWESVTHMMLITRRVRKILLRVDIALPTLILAGVFHTALTLAINITGLLIAFVHFGVPISGYAVFIFIPLILTALFGLSLGVPIAGISYLYQDASHALSYLNQLIFWLTPVVAVFPVAGTVGKIFKLNPLTHLLQSFRGLLTIGGWDQLLNPSFVTSAATAIICFLIGVIIYKATARLAVEFVL